MNSFNLNYSGKHFINPSILNEITLQFYFLRYKIKKINIFSNLTCGFFFAYGLFRSIFFHFRIFGNFLDIILLLIFNSTWLWSEILLCDNKLTTINNWS